jgi:hypothetical protein
MPLTNPERAIEDADSVIAFDATNGERGQLIKRHSGGSLIARIPR